MERERQGIVLAHAWLLERLDMFNMMEDYLRSLYSDRPGGTWIENIADTMISAMVYEYKPRFARIIESQIPHRYEARSVNHHWSVYDTQESKVVERQSKSSARYKAAKLNGYHLCIGSCHVALPHTNTRVSEVRSRQFQHAKCQICGEERII
jgi:hypothetical protein